MTFYNYNHKRATLTKIGKNYFIGRNLNYAGHSKMTSLGITSDPHDNRRRGAGFQSDWCKDISELFFMNLYMNFE